MIFLSKLTLSPELQSFLGPDATVHVNSVSKSLSAKITLAYITSPRFNSGLLRLVAPSNASRFSVTLEDDEYMLTL